MLQVETGFATYNAPRDDLAAALMALVKSAKQSIHCLVYGFTLVPLFDQLIAAHQSGLEVSVILDHTQAAGKAEAPQVQRLVTAKVPLLVGTSPEHHQILHTKQVIIDGRYVEDGSYNYSTSAGFQANTMHILDSVEYARQQIAEHQFIARFIRTHEAVYQPAGSAEVQDTDLAIASFLPTTGAS